MDHQSAMHQISHIAHSLFAKNFFSVFHGSISARITQGSFIINSKDAILDTPSAENFIKVDFQQRDYRWKLASNDVHIHEHIYTTIPSAKYICYTMPPYATAYALRHNKVIPEDYYGSTKMKTVLVYDPKNFDDWMERAPYEIAQFFKRNDTRMLLIKGFGLISYDRDLIEIAKKISILENSCRLLLLSNEF